MDRCSHVYLWIVWMNSRWDLVATKTSAPELLLLPSSQLFLYPFFLLSCRPVKTKTCHVNTPWSNSGSLSDSGTTQRLLTLPIVLSQAQKLVKVRHQQDVRTT
ncbi:hypothetical protein HRR83_000742 [Exophiala dermatitidis]|nr:hypothetical protein HRR74_000746 [Exophiala dermatitidis]KAJ4528624.1 hypothetical protein HRR73_001247 [Exophiala dermatitidis]KAJ4529999.1 hypothetical protein HRR76_009243 [Exophiala dermatitidis]KAJ4558762.1 hypothetical protein HRR77_000744 [Exophiala dermatitidis]KAJ4581210.1 hypothetical protein HRR79_000256 [Exophiala dermatitidis]